MQRDNEPYADLTAKIRDGSDPAYLNSSTTVTRTEIQAITDRQYHTLFEMLSQGVLCQDAEGRITMANAAAQSLLGYSEDELYGRTPFDPCWQSYNSDGTSFPIDQHPTLVALRTGKPVYSVPMSLFHPKEHTYQNLILSAVPLFRPNERIPFQVYTVVQSQVEQSLSMLKATAQTASARVAELEAIFDALSESIAVYDSESHIIEMSDALRELLGVPLAADAAGASVSATLDLRDEQKHLLTDEGMPIWRILHGEVISHTHAIDLPVRTRQGLERFLSISGSPIYDQAGALNGAVAIIQDVTARRDLERRTQRALDAILAMAEALVQEEPEQPEQPSPVTRVEDASLPVERSLAELPCRLLDCQRVGIALLDPDTETLHPMIVVGISQEHAQHWRHSLEGARLQNVLGDPRLIARLRAGQVLSLDASLPLFRDHPSYKMITPIMKGNQLLGILLLGYGRSQPTHTQNELAIIQAIARLASLVIEREKAHHERDQALQELQAANQELERANKVKSNFVSMVSHEFRTALTGIQGFSEIIRDENLTLPEAREFAVDIYTDARRLGRMISDMLDLDRMEAERMEVILGWTDLNAIILDVVAHMRVHAGNHNLRLQLASALPILPGDYDKLIVVMTNLLDNALKYSPDGGEIVISSVVEGNMVHVSVKDTGMGIAPVDLERIFERFSRADMGMTRFVESGGLGLPTVREIIQMHGGQVWAESILGKGSVFHFTIPFTGHPLFSPGRDTA